jgi:hypothetical protein
MKFNIGDKVKVFRLNTEVDDEDIQAMVGKESVITGYIAGNRFPYEVDLVSDPDSGYRFREDELELFVPSDNNDLADLVAKLCELNKQAAEITKQIQQLITKGEAK